jgi:hypothetical protein
MDSEAAVPPKIFLNPCQGTTPPDFCWRDGFHAVLIAVEPAFAEGSGAALRDPPEKLVRTDRRPRPPYRTSGAPGGHALPFGIISTHRSKNPKIHCSFSKTFPSRNSFKRYTARISGGRVGYWLINVF